MGIIQADTIQGVIFDLDGTLANTLPLCYKAFNHAFEKYIGRRFKDEEIRAMFGPPEEGMVARVVGAEHCQDCLEDYWRFYAEFHDTSTVEIEGIWELLDSLKSRRVKTGIVTGKGPRSAAITLQKLGLDTLIDTVVTGVDVVVPKPDPEGIFLAMKHLELRPGHTVFVGDSWADIKAGRAAGVTTVAALWVTSAPGHVAILKEAPDHVFYAVPDFAGWLAQHLPDHRCCMPVL
ncbi:MAG: HAD family hydrolase [Firmicutes bacterium]|nr:HAD family hydrolase [Bacillota bacterium]